MNGPGVVHSPDEDGTILGDYSIAPALIYACFAWSKVGEAFKASFSAAESCAVGLFEVSSDSARVWLPVSGSLTQVFPPVPLGFFGVLRRFLSKKAQP